MSPAPVPEPHFPLPLTCRPRASPGQERGCAVHRAAEPSDIFDDATIFRALNSINTVAKGRRTFSRNFSAGKKERYKENFFINTPHFTTQFPHILQHTPRPLTSLAWRQRRGFKRQSLLAGKTRWRAYGEGHKWRVCCGRGPLCWAARAERAPSTRRDCWLPAPFHFSGPRAGLGSTVRTWGAGAAACTTTRQTSANSPKSIHRCGQAAARANKHQMKSELQTRCAGRQTGKRLCSSPGRPEAG